MSQSSVQVVRIPILKSSFRLIVVSNSPLSGAECDEILAAQGATEYWLAPEWSGVELPGKNSPRAQVWAILSKEDLFDALDAFTRAQDIANAMLKDGGYTRNRAKLDAVGGKVPYCASFLPKKLDDTPVWFFDGSEVADDQAKPSDLAKRDLTGCLVMDPIHGGWVNAVEYGPIKERIVVKPPAPPVVKPEAPAKPEAPVKPEAPAKPKAPAKGGLTDVTKEVQAKLGIS